ncbi:mersacidin/lichenicidin family type 2 lantibiotic [Micromonospora sp. NPDC049230]|uniref:mersacidin/lichenicidin family type 2 lantibiotic n=1 Tax=Micromonospora sp. NPDC049230 TaxID=3155502 RepID=UPI0033E2BCE6
MNEAVKAWKDPAFRATLNDADLAALPAHPVGDIEFDDLSLDETRGLGSESKLTFGCCPTQVITSRTCITCYEWPCE